MASIRSSPVSRSNRVFSSGSSSARASQAAASAFSCAGSSASTRIVVSGARSVPGCTFRGSSAGSPSAWLWQ